MPLPPGAGHTPSRVAAQPPSKAARWSSIAMWFSTAKAT